MNEEEMRAYAGVAAKNSLDLGTALDDDPLLSGLPFLQSIAFSSVAYSGLSDERMSVLEYLSERTEELSRAKLVALLEAVKDLTTFKEYLN